MEIGIRDVLEEGPLAIANRLRTILETQRTPVMMNARFCS